MSEEKFKVEEIQSRGEDVLAKVKDIVHQGNIRRISIRNEKGVTLIEIPLTLGVVGAAIWPVWAAIGALAALVAQCTIVVEKVEP